MTNEFGEKLDRYGYSQSVFGNMSSCFLCGKRNCKLDRHEIFGNAYRDKSKRLGLWVLLCHDGCHQGNDGVHRNASKAEGLRKMGQTVAMMKYGWSTEDFIKQFGKNYL